MAFQRTWSDDDLRDAISSQHSWRGTARALGLRGTSAGVLRGLKRRATALDLDTSHFTGQRKWSDRQLRDAVARADTWSDVLSELRVFDNGETRVRVKGHAVRLGIDISHLRQPGGLGTRFKFSAFQVC